MKENFWLLDVNYEVKNNKPEVWIWGINDRAERILIIDRNFTAYFYLTVGKEEKPEEVVKRIMMIKEDRLQYITKLEPTKRKLFGKTLHVIKVYCQDPNLISKYSRALSKVKGVKKSLEDDIRYSMRYLIDNDVTPCAWYEVEVENMDQKVNVQVDKVYVAVSTPKRIERDEIPELKILGFSMICYSQKGTPRPERNPVIMLAVATNGGEDKLFAAENYDDKALFENFLEFVKSFDPDIIVGFGTNKVDWQYLSTRSKKLGIKFDVDRAGTEPHTSLYGHISITGRANIDVLDFADEFPDIKVKTLENMADYLRVMRLAERTLVEEIDFPDYWDNPDNRPTLVRFAEENTRSIMGIFNAISDFAIQLSQLVGLPLDQIGRAAVGFRVEWYLIRNAYKLGELIPERRQRPYIPYAGGVVLEPKPGIHEEVAVLDFKSMYPNVMIEQNISPDTYIPPTEPKPPEGVNVAPEVKHTFRKEPSGFYKRVLSDLIGARDEIRGRLRILDPQSVQYRVLDARQKAVKVLTNASYGYAGWIGARWYIKPVAEATTAWGRKIIRDTISLAEKMRLEVIYSDTDSIFIRYEPKKIEQFSKIIEDQLGLEIKPDKIYTRVLFTEAKKRYCGLLPNGQLDIVGLEVVRGDWAGVAKDVQERILELVLKERTPDEAVKFVHRFIRDMRETRTPYRDLIIWKTLTKPVEKYAVRAPHVEAAKLLKKEGWDLAVGEKVGYVITAGSGKLYVRAKPHILASYDEIDIEYYVTNQVIPAAARILFIFNIKEEELLPPKSPRTLFDFMNNG